MDSIRINNGVKVIEVNDAGDTIRLPLSDDSFVKGFYGLLNDIKTRAEAISAKKADIAETIDDGVKFDEEVRDKTDALIGEDTCKKVFGDVLPSSDMFIELFTKLLPFIEEHTNKRVANMNKYSAERVGSV